MLLNVVMMGSMVFPGYCVRNPIPTRPAKNPEVQPELEAWSTWAPDDGWTEDDSGNVFRYAARNGENAMERQLDPDRDTAYGIPAEQIWALIDEYTNVRGTGDGIDGQVLDPVDLEYAWLWDFIQRDGFEEVDKWCQVSAWWWWGNGEREQHLRLRRGEHRPRPKWTKAHGFINEEGLPEWIEDADRWAEMDDAERRQLAGRISAWSGTVNHDPFDVDVLVSA